MLLALLSALLSAGCMTAPATKPAAIKTSDELGLRDRPITPLIPSTWWTVLGDADLNRIIDAALAGNPGLRLSKARIAQAQAGVEFAQADLGPRAAVSADVRRQRFSATGLVPAALAGATRNLATVQADLAWEFDFFGRHEVALRGAIGHQQTAEAELLGARGVLTNDITRHYVKLGRLVEERQHARTQLELRLRLAEYISRRIAAGLDTRFELRLAQSPPALIRERIADLEGQMMVVRHALAALSGQPSETYTWLEPDLRKMKPLALPLELPADLLSRRADLAAARWRVEAALSEVDHARLDFLPSVNLAAFAGLSSIGVDRLLNLASRQYGVGPAVRLPIFDAGRLKAQLSRRSAELDAAIEAYNQAMFNALRDVVDQLSIVGSLERQRAEHEAALVAARAALSVTRSRFEAGLATRLAVLNGEGAVLDLQSGAIDLDGRTFDARIALVRTLGGGFADTMRQRESSPSSSAVPIAEPDTASGAAPRADASGPSLVAR